MIVLNGRGTPQGGVPFGATFASIQQVHSVFAPATNERYQHVLVTRGKIVNEHVRDHLSSFLQMHFLHVPRRAACLRPAGGSSILRSATGHN